MERGKYNDSLRVKTAVGLRKQVQFAHSLACVARDKPAVGEKRRPDAGKAHGAKT